MVFIFEKDFTPTSTTSNTTQRHYPAATSSLAPSTPQPQPTPPLLGPPGQWQQHQPTSSISSPTLTPLVQQIQSQPLPGLSPWLSPHPTQQPNSNSVNQTQAQPQPQLPFGRMPLFLRQQNYSSYVLGPGQHLQLQIQIPQQQQIQNSAISSTSQLPLYVGLRHTGGNYLPIPIPQPVVAGIGNVIPPTANMQNMHLHPTFASIRNLTRFTRQQQSLGMTFGPGPWQSPAIQTTPFCIASLPPLGLNSPKPVAECAAPPNWPAYCNVASVSATNTLFVKMPVDPESEEYKVLEEMVTCVEIDKIERVVNPDLWKKFVNQRKEILTAKSNDLKLLEELGLPEKELELREIAIRNFTQTAFVAASEYSDNVALLFHCTRGSVDDVLEQGLDERLSNPDRLLGRGIYFSDNPSKSVSYDSHCGQLMVFAVFLGDCMSVDHLSNSKDFVREPKKVNHQQRNRSDLFFDSIVGRPNHSNEFVIYNRNQCCPLYLISYKSSSVEPEGRSQGYYFTPFGQQQRPRPTSNNKYFQARSILPPFAWSPPVERASGAQPLLSQMYWPFLTQTIFHLMSPRVIEGQLEGIYASGNSELGEELSPPPSPPSPEPSTSRCSGAFGIGTIQDKRKLSRSTRTIPIPNSSSASNQNIARGSNSPQEIFKKPKTTEDGETGEEQCQICCDTTDQWEQLNCCNWKLCIDCFKKLEKNGVTMSRTPQTWFKCPFCQVCNGIEIGSCPDGEMRISFEPYLCEGHESADGSICIMYYIDDGLRPSTYRRAYLPNSPEGNRILQLLGVAWDRRLCFAIGTSATTGRQDTLIWNIHHKTSWQGGVQCYGYPDPTYLDRVLAELKQYGIE